MSYFREANDSSVLYPAYSNLLEETEKTLKWCDHTWEDVASIELYEEPRIGILSVEKFKELAKDTHYSSRHEEEDPSIEDMLIVFKDGGYLERDSVSLEDDLPGISEGWRYYEPRKPNSSMRNIDEYALSLYANEHLYRRDKEKYNKEMKIFEDLYGWK